MEALGAGVFVFIGGVWLVLSAAVGTWAKSKGINRVAAFLLAFFFSPLIGAIVVGLMPVRPVGSAAGPTADPAKEERLKLLSGDWKRCPHCTELIRRAASVCPHCQRDL